VSSAIGVGMFPLSAKEQRANPFASSLQTRKAATVNKNIYSWGDKLVTGSLKTKGDRFSGMYRFDTSTPGAPRSTYLTFRVMSEKSKGWIVPAQPGQHIVKKVVDDMQPKAEAAIKEAFKRSF
jgi:hypothetical protein